MGDISILLVPLLTGVVGHGAHLHAQAQVGDEEGVPVAGPALGGVGPHALGAGLVAGLALFGVVAKCVVGAVRHALAGGGGGFLFL